MFLGSRSPPQRRGDAGSTLGVTFALVTSLLMTVAPVAVLAAGQQALQLNGSSQYATLGSTSQLRSATFTVELWFKRTGAGRRHEHRHRRHPERDPAHHQGPGRGRDRRPPTSTTSWASTPQRQARGRLRGGPDRGDPEPQPPDHRPPRSCRLNVWHHAAATYDGSTWNLYLDGVLDGTLAVGRPIRPTPRPPS